MKQFFKSAFDFGRSVGHILSSTIFRVLTLVCIALIMQHVNLDLVLYAYAGGSIAPYAYLPIANVFFGDIQYAIPAFDVLLSDIVAIAGVGYFISGMTQIAVLVWRSVWNVLKRAWAYMVQTFKELGSLGMPIWNKFVVWFKHLLVKVLRWALGEEITANNDEVAVTSEVQK